MGAFLQALSALAPVAPALSDARDLRTARDQQQQQFAQDQQLKQAQLTTQQMASQLGQQRVRAGNQAIPRGDPYWEGTKMVQPVLDPDKGLTTIDAPWAETPQQKVKNFADEYQRVYGKPMPDDTQRQVISQVYGVPLPKTTFKQYEGAAGQAQKDPSDGHYYIRGTDENGNPARQDVGTTPTTSTTELSADEAAQLNKLYKADPKTPYFTEGMSRANASDIRKGIDDRNSTNRQASALADRGSWSLADGSDGVPILFNSKTGQTTAVPAGMRPKGWFDKNIAPLDAAESNIKNYLASGTPNGPDDLALQHEFFTATQPSTGFRMTKVQQDTLNGARSVWEGMKAKVQHTASGVQFSDDQRKQIAAAALRAIATKRAALNGGGGVSGAVNGVNTPKNAEDYWAGKQ